MRLLTMCLRNLTRRKLRTALCITGVAVAACFMVAVGATTLRYAEIVTEMNVFFRGKIVVVPKGVLVVQGFPVGGAIPQSVIGDIEQVAGVEKAVPMLFSLELRPGETSSVMPVNATIGLPNEELPLMIGSATLKPEGKLPAANSTEEAIVGSSVADQYGIQVGSKINLRGREFTVCALVEGPSALLGRSIIISLGAAQEVLRYPMQINMAIVEPQQNASQEELANRIEEEIDYALALTEDERNELTKPILDVVENWNTAIQGTLLFLSMILVAIVGMMGVSERRRDFATLDAIGAPSSYVPKTILLENSLIGILGSVFGVILGSVAAAALASFYTTIPISQFVSSILLIVPPIFVARIIALVTVTCCIGGLIPALNASRTRISEVLKVEY
jgi:putative ABC transport system permease protein